MLHRQQELFAVAARSGPRWRVEVTDVSGSLPSALLTANELKAAEDHSDWTLADVTSALSTRPSAPEFSTGSDAIALAEPHVSEALMLGERGRPHLHARRVQPAAAQLLVGPLCSADLD